MKAKYLLLGVGALLAAAGLWTGRTAWRVQHQLVTLDVRNMPLAEVLRKIEGQTWRKLRAEKALDACITLHVKDKPLARVLDRIAEQSGAHWSTVYAVYKSGQALSVLDSALCAEGKLEPVGWTKIAPKIPEMEESDSLGIGPGPAPVVRSGPNLNTPGPIPDKPRMMMMRRTAAGPVVFMGGPNGQTEVWSPEELVIESALAKQLEQASSPEVTALAAVQTARKVNGRWTTYFAFRKSAMGIGFGGPPGPGADPLKRGPNDRFARLTPEQRVLRARERIGLDTTRKVH